MREHGPIKCHTPMQNNPLKNLKWMDIDLIIVFEIQILCWYACELEFLFAGLCAGKYDGMLVCWSACVLVC